MNLPEVECIFDTSMGIQCLKSVGKSVGLSGVEIEEAARRCNSYEKLIKQKEKLIFELLAIDHYCRANDIDIEQALKELEQL